MDIKQTSTHLQRLGQPFDVIITKNGTEKTLYTNLDPTDVEGLLNEIIDTHKPDTLVIQERRKNGSTNIKLDKYHVSLGGISPIPPQQNNAMHNSVNVSNIPADFKDYMISDLKEKKDKQDKLIEKLETENEKLKAANFELTKENKYKDKEFELDKRATEYEKSSGLAGIVDTVASNPALTTIVATAVGRLMGIDLGGMSGLEALPQSTATQSGEATANDTPQAKIGTFVRNWIVGQTQEVATDFFELTQFISGDTDLIAELLNLSKELQNENA